MQTSDWTRAYDNSHAVGGSEPIISQWQERSNRFKHRADGYSCRLGLPYGDSERQQVDLFLPLIDPVGLIVFVHGGYWMRLERGIFSHLAAGATQCGWAVAMPGYDLCPDIDIEGISKQVANAVTCVANLPEFKGKPIHLSGHSAGGHLVTRIVSQPTDSQEGPLLDGTTCERVRHVISISGIHDLRPLINTDMNTTLGLDQQTACSTSPALLQPAINTRLTCWVGNDELSELKRQSALLANIWTGFDIQTQLIAEPGKNHFNVIDAMEDKTSPLLGCLLSSAADK